MLVAKGGKVPSSLISGSPNLALGVAITMSPKAASSHPPPSAAPLTPTTSGLPTSSKELKTRAKASSIWKTRSVVYSGRSTPPQNAFDPFAATSRMTLISGWSCRVSTAIAISVSISPLRALFGGRFRVSRAWPSRSSQWMKR